MRSNHAPTRISSGRARIATFFGCFLLAALPAVAEIPPDTRDRAVELYSQGRYDQALPLLREIDAAGQADGALLYRLYYCLRHADDPGAQAILNRAREALEREVPGAIDLESSFYLANAYRNVGRLTDASSVAARATARVESGDIPAPVSGVEMFHLGKLYADQERVDEAADWYALAIDELTPEGEQDEAATPYVDWAGRYLAEQAWIAGDYERSMTYLSVLNAAGLATPQDLDHLAMAGCRTGKYAEAKAAWQSAERANPTDANRPRYCWRLAALAETIAPLPETASDGRKWEELSKDEMESSMNEQVRIVRDAIAEAKEATKLKKKQRRKLQERIDQARALFVATALEYALRGHSIREVAFFNGFAPMIFHAEQWELPQE